MAPSPLANFGTLLTPAGEATHTLTTPEIPAHAHTLTGTPGYNEPNSGQGHRHWIGQQDDNYDIAGAGSHEQGLNPDIGHGIRDRNSDYATTGITMTRGDLGTLDRQDPLENRGHGHPLAPGRQPPSRRVAATNWSTFCRAAPLAMASRARPIPSPIDAAMSAA